jgi:hypothetical protein
MRMPTAVVLADRGSFTERGPFSDRGPFTIGPIDLLKPEDEEALARSASTRASLSPATLPEPELLPWRPSAAIGEPPCNSF